MRERIAQAILIGVVLGGAVSASLFHPAELGGRRFWSDGATYYAMAWSLALDGDVRYEAKDVARVRQEYPAGPQGVFLKRSSGALIWDANHGFPWIRRVGDHEKRVYFAKSFAYPLFAAPFVRLIGSRGLVLANVLLLGSAIYLAFGLLRRTASPFAALAAALVLFCATVAPAYVFWYPQELFNLACITAALVAWRRDRPVLSAVLLAVATYSKPYNVLLALATCGAPLVEGAGVPIMRRILEASRRGGLVVAATALLFGLHAAVTGEANYQGGERKTFHTVQFPFEGQVTFGNSGEWMTTNRLGPLVAGQKPGAWDGLLGPLRSLLWPGQDDAPSSSVPPAASPHYLRSERAVTTEDLRQALPRNLVYFWVGRNAGAALYFFPAIWAAVLFLVGRRRPVAGWLALLCLGVSWIFYVRMIPENWYGGSGALGNRYFFGLLPLGLILIPKGREWIMAIGGALVGLVFVGPILANPLFAAIHGGRHTLLPQFRLAPLELTMLNNLTIFGEPGRMKQPVGDLGDEAGRRPPAPDSYFLYFPDDSTYRREEAFGGAGFWLKGGAEGEVVLRAHADVRLMRITLRGGPDADRVKVRLGSRSVRLALQKNEERTVEMEPGRPFIYHGTRVYLLRFRSANGGWVNDPTPRRLGTFVRIALEPS